MKKLAETHRANGYDYIQLARRGDWCLFGRCGRGTTGVLGYEVFKVKVSPEEKVFNTVYPLRETYPSNEDFGTNAYAIHKKGKAIKAYLDLSGDHVENIKEHTTPFQS